ncbi:MAG: hypothetical protein ABSF72_12095 [Candidatus Sulfotelmatobacter sp.]|jgi:hypothetical protein
MELTTSTPAAAKPAQSTPPETSVRSDLRKDVRSDVQSNVPSNVQSNVQSNVRNDLRNAVRRDAKAQPPSGFGLPCSNCRLYYPANLDVCPACNSRMRVSPGAVPAIPKAQVAAESTPDRAVVEREREAFLKELESKIAATPEEVTSAIAVCSLENHRAQDDEPASICKPCYGHLQERIDVFEAALHMDLKEAAQIIYDAVWSDPSDPGKTYTNAASALLSELRKRSGVSTVLGPFHPRGN